MKKKIVCAALAMTMSLTLLAGCGKEETVTTSAPVATEAVTASAATEAGNDTESKTTEEQKTEPETEPVTEEVTEAYKPEEPDEYQQYPDSAEYHLVWEENFDQEERKLSKDDWNYEAHKAGWVNRELQAYKNTEEYAFVKNGELVIQPTKEVDDSGKVSYYSGRVNTSRKHDFKYGLMEAKIKIPKGKGFLPAFWMLPTQTSLYGNWPRCGEIDIMEVVSNDPTKEHGTIHFGDPHEQRQGSVSNGANYSEEYHVFAVEWLPGLIRWYVDGEKFFETSDWFTASNGEEKPYPAPFDQDFHIILNVAVGGDWPGDPDPDLVFDENVAMHVDYVRVYQKDSYDENVKKPEQ